MLVFVLMIVLVIPFLGWSWDRIAGDEPSLTQRIERVVKDNAQATEDQIAAALRKDGFSDEDARFFAKQYVLTRANGAPADNGSATTNGQTGNNFPPVLHHFGDCPPEMAAIGGCSLDVGVHDDQIGLAFGVVVNWPKGNKADAQGRCDLVILTPGWYENLHLTDARFEIYTIGSDREGWIKNLAQQRADEQAGDYSCPTKDFENIPQWTSDIKSPPPGVDFDGTTTTKQSAAVTNDNATTPSQNDCETVNCLDRRPAGTFKKGEAVYGYAINLDNGQTRNQCWMLAAPSSGTVTDGVINPWKAEVAKVKTCS